MARWGQSVVDIAPYLAEYTIFARLRRDDAAFRAAFAGIKPQDCVIVGHYPRFKNEIQENAERVRAILGNKT